MRSLLMASAALIMSTGFAMAQTSNSAPAPTGAPNATIGTPSGSPGNMAPAKSASGQGAMSPSAGSASGNMSSSTAPAPTGAPNAAQTTQGASPGNMAPSKSASSSMGQSNGLGQPSGTGKASGISSGSQTASNGMTASPPMTHHHGMGMRMASLPANGNAETYLHIAKMAIRNHEQARAEDALSHAETRMLTRAVSASSATMADNSPGVTAIENASSALRNGNYAQASAEVDTAMQNIQGGMGNGGVGENASSSGGMSGSAVMGNGSMNNGAMGNSAASGGMSGPAGTSQ